MVVSSAYLRLLIFLPASYHTLNANLQLAMLFRAPLMAQRVKNALAMQQKGTTEDEMVGWHHQLDGHGFGWTLGVGDEQGGLACCGSWGRKESDMTEQLN